MSDDPDDTQMPRALASSPCMLHELADDLAPPGPASSWPEVARWRRAERQRQIDERLGIDPALRREHSARIVTLLQATLGDVRGLTVSMYWPIRGEPDLRGLADAVIGAGGRCALPVVEQRASPLTFRAWSPGDRLERGFWGIPVPCAGAEVTPDILIAPVVAFDREGFRLGYGGGYFDRTLAALQPRRRVLGVGYAASEIETIHPQPHDVPMDAVVTETGVRAGPQRSTERRG